MSSTVRTATSHDIDAASEVLSAGFADDPLMTALWPQTSRRHDALVRYFAMSLRYTHLRNGGVQVCTDARDEIAGVAVWDPPGKVWAQPPLDFMRSLPAVVDALRERIPAALKIKATLRENQPNELHWYLANIATRPDVRGHGHADRMLKARLACVDDVGVPAYLVCTRQENISFYARHGFGVTREFVLPVGHKPTMWAMNRPVRHA